MEWIRGIQVGRGSFGTVDLVIPKPNSQNIENPPSMVVKSSEVSISESLKNEREILFRLGGDCPQIVKWFGESRTSENGRNLYNLFFEYAAGGSLADQIKVKKFSELDSRQHANSILKGLAFIHDSGFVHCDIKLQNLLLFADGKVKISDFGLAREKKNEIKSTGFELRGTPLYMSPEVVAGSDGESPADIWALGCSVIEMMTGKPAWSCESGCGVGELLCRIATGKESPLIPESMSEDGKDFLSKCFVKDPNRRWTARMLLDHPFVSGLNNDEDGKPTTSPRGPFDFPELTPTASELSVAYYSSELEEELYSSESVLNRVNTLAGNPVSLPDWSDFDNWVTIR